MREDFSLDAKAGAYATQNPKYLTDAEMLASDALKIIEENKLQHLVITDKERHIEGILHIHDLIEAGIK
ncbi:Arabinose 5-phosphate isomerase KdsD [compost metagenome]